MRLKIILLLLCGFMTSCRYNHHFAKKDLLLTKNVVVIEGDQDEVKNKGELVDGVNTLIRQKPNSSLWGFKGLPRYKLWRYNLSHKLYTDSPRHKNIRDRKVEAPVFINPTSIRLSDSSIKQYMINNGYYDSKVRDTLVKKANQEAKVTYTITPGKRYYIKKVTYNVQNERMKALVEKSRGRSYLKKGKAFRNIDLGQERERLYTIFRNAGYYGMKVENMNGELDSIDRSSLKDVFENPFGMDIESITRTGSKDSIEVFMNLFPTRDSTYDQQYTINRVYIKFKNPFQSYKGMSIKEVAYKDVIFQYHEVLVKEKVIYENIFVHPKQLYSTKNVEATYNRLNQLGTFGFVGIRFKQNSRSKNSLDCYIELTMANKRDINLNVDMSTGEDYLAGFGLGANLNTKNLWRGANKLNIQTQYAIELRPSNRDRIADGLLLNANNFSASANLSLPKFLIPFRLKTARGNTPFTVLSLAHNRVNRVGSFKLSNTTAKMAYSWKETPKKSWLLSPMFLSLTNVGQLSQDFDERIKDSRFLLNTYSNNFIQGENVSFEYKSDLTGTAVNSHTFNIGFEEAGLLMQGVNLINRAVSGKSISPIAHYVRADFDYRYYHTRRKFQWASRAMVGIGLPTFGDISLPYIKQYSQGGAFSNRGWQLRNLGPGRTLPEASAGRQLVDRTGDFKLELSTELRFPVARIGIFELKGATFADAGNIWLFREDATTLGGQLRAEQLWQDIAISSGLGLRLDFSFFVFRLDHAWRLKYPYKLENNGWAINALRLNDGQWNIAIGYPF